MAVGMWDTTVNIMGIPYYENMKILGIHFTRTASQSALKSWSVVTDGLREQAREAYYRELSLNKRMHFVHTYMLACAWFTAQIFPMPRTCERQINTAITWFLWRGSIFRVPVSTIQRRKLQSGWDLINVSAKSRALLHFRLQAQSTAPGTLTADWFRKWNLQIPGPNPPQIQRIPANIEYPHQFAMDGACITPQQKNETSKAYKRRIYDTTATLLRETPELPVVRISRLWTTTDWTSVWSNLRGTPVPEDIKMDWYRAIHNIIRTQDRLNRIDMAATNLCRH